MITVDLNRDLHVYTKNGFHLNAKGKEQVAKRVALAMKNLFGVNMALLRALKWKDKEDRDSYPSANKQMLDVQEVKASCRENKVLLQTYGNSESGDQIKK
jgi:hypothetical protein